MQVVIAVDGDIVPVVQQEVTANFDPRNDYVCGTVSTGGLCTGAVRVGLYDSTGALRGSGNVDRQRLTVLPGDTRSHQRHC